jgi:acyl-CoA synthetase (AMP-forming)/AMP-acid ligase II
MVSRFLTLHHPAEARRFYEQGVWQNDTLYGLVVRHAAARPEAIALVDGSRTLSWRGLQSWVDGVALDLRTYGLSEGDRVSIWMSNRIEAIVTFLACAREGFACNPSLHRTHTCSEMAALLERLSAKALVTEPRWGADWKTANLNAALAGIHSLRAVYTPDTFPRPAPNMTPPCDDPDKVAYLAFTSGTTGSPKCVMHSDNTLLANARDLARDWGHDSDTVILTLSPLSHHIAWVALAQWMLLGCQLVTDDPPPGTGRLDWILEKRATYVMGVPTHAMDILAEQRARGIPTLGAVKVFYMAGAPIPPSVAAAFVDQGVKPQNVYGMTENSSHQYTHPDDAADTIISTCGRGGHAYEVRIFDPVDADRELPRGEVGQIGGRGGCLMLGYFDNQAATEASFNRGGWFMSGDLGVLDAAGNLRIDGRLKDMIIRGGHNIYPAHIEALALRNGAVKKVACFPIRDDRLGERVCISVIGEVTADDLLKHLADQGLSRFDMPEFFVRLEAFPLTASGKILKRELIHMVERGEIAPESLRLRAREDAGP